jgi:hypothetical protein
VFGISLSSEYACLAEAWHLTREQVLTLAERGVGYIFCTDEAVLARLRTRFVEARKALLLPASPALTLAPAPSPATAAAAAAAGGK